MNGRYYLARPLYFQTIWAIRNYQRLKERHEELLHASPPPPDGMPHGGPGKGDVDRKAIALAEIDTQIAIIDKAKEAIPEEYMRGIWSHIQYGTPFPHDAGINTYKRWKQRFVYTVALLHNWI